MAVIQRAHGTIAVLEEPAQVTRIRDRQDPNPFLGCEQQILSSSPTVQIVYHQRANARSLLAVAPPPLVEVRQSYLI